VEWDCGTTGLGIVIGDSLMFERGDPTPSDAHLSHIYGLALPLLKRGMPVTPVQLENFPAARNYLEPFRLLLLTYQGMKPLSAEVHASLAQWVKDGGVLVVVDDDSDPYNSVRDWWNTTPFNYPTPRAHLFEQLGLSGKISDLDEKPRKVGKGFVTWLHENPTRFAANSDGDARLVKMVMEAASAARLKWRESNHLLLRRGPYIVAAGLDESIAAEAAKLRGNFVNLFDPQLRRLSTVDVSAGKRFFLLDLDQARGKGPRVLASACKAIPTSTSNTLSLAVEGVAGTPAVVLLQTGKKAPQKVTLSGQPLNDYEYSAADGLLWIRFPNESKPQVLTVNF
jgi:hypothetical protein